MKGQYKVNSPDLRPLWVEAHRRANQLEKFEIVHTLRGGNKEADQLANDAMDRGMGRAPAAAPAPVSGSSAPKSASQTSPKIQPREAAQPARSAPRQVLEGFVKNGVVHPIDGELPDGIFVKIIRE
jgi:probable phosphoglycerate mutase